MILAGAVNGVPATLDVIEGSDKTLNIADDGVASTIDVQTDGNNWDEDGISSRVAIIGGTTSGRDHFPFPTSIVTSGVSTSYPFGANSLSDCAVAFFRVRKWGVDINVTIEDPPHDLTTSFIVEAGSYIEDEVISQIPYSAEWELLNPRETYYFKSAILGVDEEYPYPVLLSMFADINGLSYLESGPGVGYDSGFRLKCYLQIDASIDTTGPTGESGVELDFILPENPTAGVLTMYGSSNYHGDVQIYPVEFWPYADKNGDPVYNTSTGEQLRDPLG